uniref:Cleft lip and palate transmembrane protein 1-like protein n=1 Tax=Phaeomonas parva TaxID=124430 RepID=A0A7S1UEK9_9STRA
MGLAGWCNVSSLAALAAVLYVTVTFSRIGAIVNPLTPVPGDEAAGLRPAQLIAPAWPAGTTVRLFCYLSPHARLRFSNLTAEDAPARLLWEATVPLGAAGEPEAELRVEPSGFGAGGFEVPKQWWERIVEGRGAFVHVVATRDPAATATTPITRGALQDVLVAVVPLVRKMEPSLKPPKRHLLCDIEALRFLVRDEDLLYCEEEYVELLKKHRHRLAQLEAKGQVPFEPQWVPEVGVKLLSEFRSYDADDLSLVRLVLPVLRGDGNQHVYQPLMHADEVGLTSDKYAALNKTTASLPLKLTVGHMSLSRFLLMDFLVDSLDGQLKEMGFSEDDVDDVRRLVADTSVLMLSVTMVASVLHLLFEFLAFRSDVNFWKNNKTLKGLSARAVAVEMLFQFIILMFLQDEGASLLVLGPAAVGVAIQAWKVKRATGLTLDTSGGFPKVRLLRLEAEAEEAAKGDKGADEKGVNWSKLTQEVDRKAWGTLTLLVVPLVTGVALRSLILERHVNWYSWILSTLTAAVYSLGFALMCPQLIINHRLKSVAQLPWRFLCYRFVNTFIDDLFAFVIKMPTMHRLSCFRDDVVFLFYLYQRWIYPTDLSRMDAADVAN